MCYKISNVKISIKTSPISLNTVLDLQFKNKKFTNIKNLKNYKNFVVLKEKYTYSIFKTNSKSENHINITKIPNLTEIQESIKHLKKYLDFSLKTLQVDNIIATLKHKNPIDLVSVCERKLFDSMKYNNERFPGLFIKFDVGTAILFHSGKIVLVGCKKEADLQCLTTNIFAVINKL